MKSLVHSLWTAAVVLPLVGAFGSTAAAQEGNMRSYVWSDHPETVELFESLPVQDGGRVKPIHTYAGFTLLRLHGKRTLETPQGEKLTPVEWLLDTLFFPEMAADYPLFLVQNDEVISSLGLSFEGKKKRDRYSLNEIRGGIPRLFELARQYGGIEEKERTTVQQQIYMLAGNVNSFLMLSDHLDHARTAIELRENETLNEIFDGQSMVTFDQVLAQIGPLRREYERMIRDESAAGTPEFMAIGGVLQEAAELVEGTSFLAMIPPVQLEEEEWHSPYDLFYSAFEAGEVAPQYPAMIGYFSKLARERNDPEAFRAELAALQGEVVGIARQRGEYEKVPLELKYYKLKLLDYSQYLFVLSFLLMAFMWLRPRNRTLHWLTSITVLVPTLLLCGAIAMRCVIRGRPPVSTLYETVLFVTAVGAIVALFMEGVNRQKIAISAAAILGTVGLFIANGYEMLDKSDTMPALVAVLDTNFWLATHVTSITIGYSAGMLAALIASVYLLAKLVGWKRNDRAFYRNMGRMVYGVICFALIFSLVGTILGGIWANDSWGRFWGWDPKENGALLICISQLVILHARMGGYLREHGVCMAAAFGGTVVAFSWWGVNLLGVGLHSYGFTSGIYTALWTYYSIQWGIVGLGGIAWLMERSRATSGQKVRVTQPAPEKLDGEMRGTTA